MSNLTKIWELFELIQDVVDEMALDKDGNKKLLNEFTIRILTILDGLEGPVGWKGIALVAKEDLPDSIPEINDGFLHELWSERSEDEDYDR